MGSFIVLSLCVLYVAVAIDWGMGDDTDDYFDL